MDLVARVKGILLTPRTEWNTIDTEPTSVGALYTGYVMPLAAIPAVAGFVGGSLVGSSLEGKWSTGSGLQWAVGQFVSALLSTFVLALIIDALAPTFGGEKSQTQALKVSAYSATAVWIAGIFMILPSLAMLSVLGIYSLYLLYLGLPVLMKAPPEKAMAYTIVVIVCGIVFAVIFRTVADRFIPVPVYR